jgi:hypothetical protein
MGGDTFALSQLGFYIGLQGYVINLTDFFLNINSSSDVWVWFPTQIKPSLKSMSKEDSPLKVVLSPGLVLISVKSAIGL